MRNISQTSILKYFAYFLSISLIALILANLTRPVTNVKIKSATAASDRGNVSFSIRCTGNNSVRSNSEYQVITKLGENNRLGSSIAVVPSSSGKTINLRAVSEGIQIYNGKEHHVAIFDGPEIKHTAFCIGRRVDSGRLHAYQTSPSENPPLLMSSGGSHDINNFLNIPANGEKIEIAKGVRSGQGISRFEYGNGTQNPYNIAIAYPSYQHGGSRILKYTVGLSSTLD